MTIIILERSPESLRGLLSRWLMELRAGVFIGTVSAAVRQELFKLIEERLGLVGAAIFVWTTNNEQGYTAQILGDPNRVVSDFDGLFLTTILSSHNQPESF
jgi:CRISPR-associated protein Cas2